MESTDTLVEEKKLMNEPKYRTYTSNIDKALRNFEYSSEWADLISALGKLSKAISSNTQYQIIPRRIKISKRLAQCMHPALPSGVHLRALETYDVIFSKTGPEKLATELFVYSAGLFPLFGYAAMNVRPALLGIYEKYFVPLGEKLRPALGGFLSGVLPGYESGLDHYERTNSLLTQVCNAVNPLYFYSCLWECVATNASIRLPAISFILEHFNRRNGMQEQTFAMGQNHDIMMSGLCACLNDSLILVQRNTLEFLLIGFPMHTKYLSEEDLIKLVTNGLNTILRRDMSLNRRLYSWLLGTEVNKNSPNVESMMPAGGESYFDRYSKQILIEALICTLKFSLESNPVDLKPYRILVSLLDKGEIGPVVLDYVLCDVIRTMSLAHGSIEVSKSANLLFATFDPAYIWNFMTIMYEKSCKRASEMSMSMSKNLRSNSRINKDETEEEQETLEKFTSNVGSGDPCLVEICYLTEFLLETISLEMYNETTRLYLPKVFLAITKLLTLYSENLTHQEITASLKLCMKIVSRVQPMITSPSRGVHASLSTHRQNKTQQANGRDEQMRNANNPVSETAGSSALEKSKSDSRLNQFTLNEEPIRRSNSNYYIDKSKVTSKNLSSFSSSAEKAKSYSKLLELDKEICPDTGQFLNSSDIDSSDNMKRLKDKKSSPHSKLKFDTRNGGEETEFDDKLSESEKCLTTNLSSDSNGNCRGELSSDSVAMSQKMVSNDLTLSEFGIIEKCIRQYEIFYEVYLSREILQINDEHKSQHKHCQVTVRIDNENPMETSVLNNEEILEENSTFRLLEINKLFETLKMYSTDSMSTSNERILKNYINKNSRFIKESSTSDLSDLEFKDCFSSSEMLNNNNFFINNSSNENETLMKSHNEGDRATISKCDENIQKAVSKLLTLRLEESLKTSIKLASNLLVEMSTFPNCDKNLILDQQELELPSWLKVLSLVSSYIQNDKDLQLSAISTLFDLISLLKSQIEHTTSPGVTFVVMLPLVKFGHVSYIENKTKIFHLLISVLWHYLGEQGTDSMQITSLLYQLHNCLESGLVERIIGNRMSYSCVSLNLLPSTETVDMAETFNNSAVTSVIGQEKESNTTTKRKMLAVQNNNTRIESNYPSRNVAYSFDYVGRMEESEATSYKKFELLWHLGRDKQPSKTFDKTLLHILDTLSLPHYIPAKSFVTKWLQESLLRGDLPRLMKPLSQILLSPKTKRIGVLYAHLLKRDLDFAELLYDDSLSLTGVRSSTSIGGDPLDDETIETSVTEGDVYAVSSEFGNIKYHMDSSLSSKKRSPIRSLQKKFFGVTLGSKNKTSNFVSDKPTSLTESESSIGLIINPLDAASDQDVCESEPSSLSSNVPIRAEVAEALVTNNSTSSITGVINTVAVPASSARKSLEEDHDCSIKSDTGEAPSRQENYSSPSSSSAEDSDDASCCTETESEQRDTSVEKEIASNNLKRFAGDCERVSEILSEHDRTKNRKTYHLTRFNSETYSSFVEEPTTRHANSEELNLTSDDLSLNNPVENFVNDLLEKASAMGSNCNSPTVEHKYRKSNEGSPKKKSSLIESCSRSGESGSGSGKKSKKFGNNDKKRMSCISKASTDSNISGGGGGVIKTGVLFNSNVEIPDKGASDYIQKTNSDSNNSNSDNESDVFEDKSVTTASTIVADSIDVAKSNMAARKKNLSLTTKKYNWEIDKDILEKSKQNVEILRRSVAMDANGRKYFKRKLSEERKRHYDRLHPFHTHMLLYFGAYDTKEVLYAFQVLRNIISSDTRTFLCLSITTAIPHGTIKNDLIRHRKSLLGKGFQGNITNTEFSQAYRGCMHLEVLVTICLYYARSFFHKETIDGEDPSLDDIIGNCKVQLGSIELLTLICTELIEIVKGMGKGLACYIADLMDKCKLQKIILHCLNSSVMMFSNNVKDLTLTEQIMMFNDPKDENLHAESYQIQLLRLLMAVIKLEYEVAVWKNGGDASVLTTSLQKSDQNTTVNGNVGSNSPTKLPATMANVKYLPNCFIGQQPMFLAAVLSALQCDNLRHLHRNWTDLVTSSLSCFNFGSLTNIVISVVHQLCNNIDKIAKLPLKKQRDFPPDYVVSLLEAITIFCHYCLLDNTQQTILSHLFNQAYPQTSAAVQSSNTGQLLNNIVHTFLSSQSSNETQNRNSQHMAARNAVLSHLSRIVASVALIWDSESGSVRQVKNQLMEFLSPISLHHGVNFLTAIAVTWQERGEQYKKELEKKNEGRKMSFSEQYLRNSLPQASSEQLNLVRLVSCIRVMPIDSFVQTLHQVVKSPPPIHRPPAGLTIEVSALELFYFYMKNAPAPQLADSWSSLLALLRDGLNLTPPAQFVLLMLLNEFVQRCPQMPFQDKKDIRDLHDVTSRLVDALSNVAGACLEQTTWLRRNLAVKEDISPVTPDGSVKDLTGNQQYCVQAQSVLAAVLANLLDVAYGAQDKDKVVTIITTLMYNIIPYLKNHTVRNIPSFYACSNLLANLSGYQYTRKAWRKDVFDLLLDPVFFQMDLSCLPSWKQIMDNLMTYDNTTFRELMGRVSLTQAGSLNIFTSREQEYEQRSMLLKRLAFVIFCSELDQYHKYMPEIQEQLTNSLRLPSVVPSVQAAVFLCFRVLLLRMSPDHVTSLWPIIIAEMVQVFLIIEQELKCGDGEELSQHLRILSGIDVPWATSFGNGLSSQTHLNNWRNVQLETAKLLELGCVLPATFLPHFQMYRWAFVGTDFDVISEERILLTNGNADDAQQMYLNSSGYVPHVKRIARLMDMKYAVHSPKTEFKRGKHLVLTCQQINSLQDLYGFFSTLNVTWPTPHNFADTDKELKSCLNEIENILALDFLEKMPSSTTTPR